MTATEVMNALQAELAQYDWRVLHIGSALLEYWEHLAEQMDRELAAGGPPLVLVNTHYPDPATRQVCLDMTIDPLRLVIETADGQTVELQWHPVAWRVEAGGSDVQ